jgi:hypothetical protein
VLASLANFHFHAQHGLHDSRETLAHLAMFDGDVFVT